MIRLSTPADRHGAGAILHEVCAGTAPATRRWLYMTVAILFGIPDAKVVEDAYNIAWDYLLRSGQIVNESRSHLVLSEAIVHLLERGERHPLRLANKAISAYEREWEAMTLDL